MTQPLSANPAAFVRSNAVTRLTATASRVGLGTGAPVAGRKVHVLETGADSGIRTEGNNPGDVALDALVTGDAAARFTATVGGFLAWGDGAAPADVQLFRGAADRLDVGTGDSLNLVLGTLQIAGTTIFEADRDVAITLQPNADATLNLGAPNRRWHLSAATVNMGDGAADDVQLFRGAANRLDLANGDSLNLVLGSFQIAGTTVFESDRDVAVDLIPSASATLDLGSSTRLYAEAHARNVPRPWVTPAQIVASQNNYAATDGFNRARLSSNGAVNITGFTAGYDGEEKWLVNVGAFNITLQHNNAGSAAANQIMTSASVDLAVPNDRSVVLVYDGTTQRWRQMTPLT